MRTKILPDFVYISVPLSVAETGIYAICILTELFVAIKF